MMQPFSFRHCFVFGLVLTILAGWRILVWFKEPTIIENCWSVSLDVWDNSTTRCYVVIANSSKEALENAIGLYYFFHNFGAPVRWYYTMPMIAVIDYVMLTNHRQGTPTPAEIYNNFRIKCASNSSDDANSGITLPSSTSYCW